MRDGSTNSLKIIKNFSANSFDVFDLYNNGYMWGGQLRVVFDGTIILNENNSTNVSLPSKPKSFRRKNFNDITIKMGIIVR